MKKRIKGDLLEMRTKTWTTLKQFMYSYEERLRAVKLYPELGRRMNATLRQLG